MLSAILAVDDGLTSGNLNVADVLFLIAAIWAGVITIVLAFQAGTLLKATSAACVPGVLCLGFIGWLML